MISHKRIRRLLAATSAAATLCLLVGAGAAVAAESAANDCLIGIEDQNDAVITTSPQTCTDGDPSCDADGAANGTCQFKIKGCINIPNTAGCTARPIKKLKFVTQGSKGLISISPVSGQASSVCGAFVNFPVPLKGKNHTKPGKRKIIATVQADVKPRGQNKDKDKILFQCNPCTSGNCSTSTTTIQGGGGDCGACPANPQGGPCSLMLTVAATGNDLDTGFTGRSHNFINVQGSTLQYCLSGCDTGTNSMCTAQASSKDAGSINGPTFGPPLPLFSANVAVCVVNNFHDNQVQAKVDIATGAFDASTTPVVLDSATYQGSPNQVCPKCVNNKCDSGKNQGQNCHVDGTVVVNNPPNIVNQSYPVSKDCVPSTASLLGTPQVSLGLTSATSTLAANAAGNFPCPGQAQHDDCNGAACNVDCSATADPKGGINQTCCANPQRLPCFPTSAASGSQPIARTGNVAVPSPAWPDPTYPKTGTGVLAAVFCIPPTSNITVDSTAGLAGPGALLLSGNNVWAK